MIRFTTILPWLKSSFTDWNAVSGDRLGLLSHGDCGEGGRYNEDSPEENLGRGRGSRAGRSWGLLHDLFRTLVPLGREGSGRGSGVDTYWCGATSAGWPTSYQALLWA